MSRRNLARFSSSAHALRRRLGLSVILIVIVIWIIVVFVAMAVDYGRLRVTKVQLQNAADSAATAGATGLEFLPNGVIEPQDRASEAAAENFSIDQANNGTGNRADAIVDLVVDEDVEFGIWRDNPDPDKEQQHWTKLESDGGGVDERRMANAVRVFGRRTKEFYDSDGALITRNTALPLIFGPVFGQTTGNVQADATAAITGGRQGTGFIGLDWVKFNGTTKTDSYAAGTEQYPGVDGANKNSAISSNGDITLVGGTQIWGDVHPGLNGSVLPNPLGGSVEVTGYMDPLDQPLTAPEDYTIPVWTPPAAGTYNPPVSGSISDGFNSSTLKFAPKGNNKEVTITSGRYLFSEWETGQHQKVFLDNSTGPIEIWVDGNFVNSSHAEMHLVSNANQVTFHINGNFDMQGGGVINDDLVARLPSNLYIEVTKANTSVDIGGSPSVFMHLNAPLSDVKLHGNGSGGAAYGFYGWAVGKTLFVTGSFEAHYDETRDLKMKPFTVRLVD